MIKERLLPWKLRGEFTDIAMTTDLLKNAHIISHF